MLVLELRITFNHTLYTEDAMTYQQFEQTLAQIAKHVQYLHSQIHDVAYELYKLELYNSQIDVDVEILSFRQAEMRMYIIQLNDAQMRYWQIRANYPEHCVSAELDAVDKIANPDDLPSWELFDHFQ